MAVVFFGFVLIAADFFFDGMLNGLRLLAAIIGVRVCWLHAGLLLMGLMGRECTHRSIKLVFAELSVVSVVIAFLS
jgi:hypothetical protein